MARTKDSRTKDSRTKARTKVGKIRVKTKAIVSKTDGMRTMIRTNELVRRINSNSSNNAASNHA